MSNNRLAEFNQHRAEVLKAHLSRDKTYLAARRKRRSGIVLGIVQVTLGTFVVLALMKSLMLANHGQAEYARIIAPALAGLDAENFVAKALLPDVVTLKIAETLRPMIADSVASDVAFGPPMPPGMVDATPTPES